MTLDKANELIALHADFGQAAVDKLIRDYGLEEQWEINPGTKFTSTFTK